MMYLETTYFTYKRLIRTHTQEPIFRFQGKCEETNPAHRNSEQISFPFVDSHHCMSCLRLA